MFIPILLSSLLLTPLVAADTPSGRVHGRAVDAKAQPLAGVLVAAVPYEGNSLSDGTRAALTTRTDGQGRFRFHGLPAGTYGITATHPRHPSAYLGQVEVRPGADLEVPEVRMEGESSPVAGRVEGVPAGALKGKHLRLLRVSSDSGDVFHLPLHQGRFEASMGSGTYMAHLDLEGWRGVPLRVTVPGATRGLALKFERVSDPKVAPSPSVDAWIKSHAVPIRTVEAGHGFQDLQPLKAMVGSARMVALGEATHGTREFFQLKHRMLEFLVSEMGFTTFAIEANQPEARALNAYVLRGEGDPAKALSGLYFWTWDTEEVLAQIRWMRKWNEDPAHVRKLTFQAFDMQFPPVALREAAAFVEGVAPDLAKTLRQDLGELADGATVRTLLEAPKEKLAALLDSSRRWLQAFDAHREVWSRKTSSEAFEVARQDMRVLAQCVENLGDETHGVRDRAMAENARWILDREGPQGRVVVWAHNMHISKAGFSGIRSMGMHLAEGLKQDYVAFGFAFNQGGFQAIQANRGLLNHEVSQGPIGSLDAALARSGQGILALDLRRRPQTGAVAEWLGSYLHTRSIGAGYAPGRAEAYFVSQRLPECYDALLFVERTTPARPNPKPTPVRAAAAQGPVNLDFEEGETGGKPAGWIKNGQGYEARLEEGDSPSGRRHVKLSRDKGAAEFGVLMQSLDATPYRGKRVRIRGWLKCEGTAKAHAWMRVDRAKGTGYFDNMADRPVVSGEWQPFILEGPVAEDATELNLGLLMIEDGAIRGDGFKVEVVEEAAGGD